MTMLFEIAKGSYCLEMCTEIFMNEIIYWMRYSIEIYLNWDIEWDLPQNKEEVVGRAKIQYESLWVHNWWT